MFCSWWWFSFFFLHHSSFCWWLNFLKYYFFSCLWTFVCLFFLFSQSQCRVGPGHRGFSNGVGGLFFAALRSKSCLSVLSSWTSCNNINGPLKSLLCCAALVWVTSHTCTLSRSEMHAYGRGTPATLLTHKAWAKNRAFARSRWQVDGHTRYTTLPTRAA